MKFKESKSIYLQIADNTMMRTYDYLQGMEIIYNKRGIGYFVGEGAKNKILSFRKETFLNEELPEMFRTMKILDISAQEISALYKQFLKDNK